MMCHSDIHMAKLQDIVLNDIQMTFKCPSNDLQMTLKLPYLPQMMSDCYFDGKFEFHTSKNGINDVPHLYVENIKKL